MMCDTKVVPIEYIDSLKTKKHIVLFYGDTEYARTIEFSFLKNGLIEGEQCIYVTDDDTGTIILKMLRFGIPSEYLQTKRLSVYQIHSPIGIYDEMLSECRKEAETIFSDLIKPLRIVTRMTSDASTFKEMSARTELESSIHKIFEDLGGSIMCSYDLSKMEKSKSSEWMSALMKSHHVMIYTSKFEGGVFHTAE